MNTSMMHNGHEFVDLGLSVNWELAILERSTLRK